VEVNQRSPVLLVPYAGKGLAVRQFVSQELLTNVCVCVCVCITFQSLATGWPSNALVVVPRQ
jgi:hypothetical protein